MRKQLLKFLLILLILLATSFSLLWLWSWYVFNVQWQVLPVAEEVGQGSAVSAGFVAGFFIVLTLVLVAVNYRLIKQ